MMRRRLWIRVLRWAMVAVSLTLGSVLFTRGDYVIGGLICALGVFRAVFLIATTRPRKVSRRRLNQVDTGPTGAGPARVRELLRGLARSEFRVAAGVIGIDQYQFRRAFNSGSSIAELAAEKGVPLDRVVKAMVADAEAQVDLQVSKGGVDPTSAQFAKARLQIWANRLANFHKGDLRRPKAGVSFGS
jgi:hypothetical protein